MILTALMLLQSAYNDAACNQAEADKGIQIEMNICAYHEFVAADAALNSQWKLTADAMKLRDENFESVYDDRLGYFQSLLEAQLAWLTFRDAHCRSEGYYARGGSLEPLLVSTCKTGLTEARTEQLAALIGDN